MTERDPNRLRIWDVECVLLDLVLAHAFDTDELSNLLHAHGVSVSPCRADTDGRKVLRAAHAACHTQNGPLARVLERNLDLLYRVALCELDLYGLESVAQELLGRDLWDVPHLPGRIWAVLTCPDERAEGLRFHLKHALQLDGIRALLTRPTHPTPNARTP